MNIFFDKLNSMNCIDNIENHQENIEQKLVDTKNSLTRLAAGLQGAGSNMAMEIIYNNMEEIEKYTKSLTILLEKMRNYNENMNEIDEASFVSEES